MQWSKPHRHTKQIDTEKAEIEKLVRTKTNQLFVICMDIAQMLSKCSNVFDIFDFPMPLASKS